MSMRIYHFLENKNLIAKMLPISIVMLFLTFGEGIITPIFSIFVNRITEDLLKTGIILSLVGIIGVITAIPLGVLIDRYNIKRVMQFCTFGTVFAPIFYVLSYDFLTLFLARAYFAVLTTLLWCVLWTYVFNIVDYKNKKEEAEEIGLSTMFLHAGLTISPVIGGIIATLSFFLPFYILAGCSFGAFLFASMVIPSAPKKTKKSLAGLIKKDFQILGDILKNYRTTIFVIVAVFSVLTFIHSFFPIFLDQAGFSLPMIGFVIFIAFLPIVFFEVNIGEFINRIGSKKAIIFSLAIGGVVSLVFSFSLHPVVVISAMIFFAIANATASITISKLTADLSIDEDRGLMAGIRKFIMTLGVASGPLVGGAVLSVFGVSQTLCIIGFFAIISSVLYFFFKGEPI